MIVLDDNVLAGQRAALEARRIHLCQIGHHIARKGLLDDGVITLLQTLRRPTFITYDYQFFKRSLCHEQYCIVWIEQIQIG